MTEHLAQLLREAAADPEPVRLQDVARRVRRTRRSRITMGAALTAAAIAAVVVPLTVPGHAGAPAEVSVAAPPALRLGIVSFDLPAGWTAGQTPCDEAPPTATDPNQCPQARGPAGATVMMYPASVLSNYSSSHFEVGPCRTSGGTITTAGIGGEVTRGCGDPPGGVLAFDLVDVGVRITAANQAQADALEHAVHLHPAASLEIPATAPSLNVGIHTFYIPQTGLSPDVTATGPKEAALLTALRQAPLLPVATNTCYPTKTAVVAVPQGRTYIISGGSCNEIVTGNGTIARTTPQLKTALSAIIGPNSLT